MDNWWLSKKTDDCSNWYFRRVSKIGYQKSENISNDPSGIGEVTTDVCFKGYDLAKCLLELNKRAPTAKNPFTHIFISIFPRHRCKKGILESFKPLFSEIEKKVIDDEKKYSKLDVDLIEPALNSYYVDFNYIAFPNLAYTYGRQLEEQQAQQAKNTDSNKIVLPIRFTEFIKIRLFNKLQLFKISKGKGLFVFDFFGFKLYSTEVIDRTKYYKFLGIPFFAFKYSKPRVH